VEPPTGHHCPVEYLFPAAVAYPPSRTISAQFVDAGVQADPSGDSEHLGVPAEVLEYLLV
jgi:hypothetical protein